MGKHISIAISPSYGIFQPNRSLQKILKEYKLSSWDSMEARTNEDVIRFIKDHSTQLNHSFLGKEKYQFLTIKEVDIDRPWTIGLDDGGESILYLDYRLTDPNLNYYSAN